MINLQIPTKLIIFALRKPKTSSGCGAVGSVRVWGACGRQFESGHPDYRKCLYKGHKTFLTGIFLWHFR